MYGKVAMKTLEERVQRPSAHATRERILAAALDLFAERSFEGASTRLIADRAGVRQPLLRITSGTRPSSGGPPSAGSSRTWRVL